MRGLIFLIALLVVATSVVAESYVLGTVYLGGLPPDGVEVGGAEVTATCSSGAGESYTYGPVMSSSEIGVVGDYIIPFPLGECSPGWDVTVEATKDDMTGTATGVMDPSQMLGLSLAVVNVNIPEFTIITATVGVLGALAGFMLLRR